MRGASKAVTYGVLVLIIIVVAGVLAGIYMGKGGQTTTTPTTTTIAPPTTTTTATTTTTQQTTPKTTVTITGSGSTFIAPQMYAWANQLKAGNYGVIVEYQSVGSGAGVANFLQGTTDFGASDPPLPRDKWQANQGKVIQMPVILGPIAIIYNIPGVTVQLNLTGEVLAKIYKGEIAYWDDPAIKTLNPSVNLPHEQIIAVHRSDASGTTEIVTTFLYKSAPNVWSKNLVGKTINWPVDSTGRGVAQKGSEGITSTVKSTPYSIGYVEWSYALDSKLPTAKLSNPLGEFIAPSAESVMKAAEAVQLPTSPLDDFTPVVDQIVYANVSGAYPLASFSFLIFSTEYPAGKVDAIKTFINYINTEGQSQSNIVKGYVPIPESLRQLNLKALTLIKAKG